MNKRYIDFIFNRNFLLFLLIPILIMLIINVILYFCNINIKYSILNNIFKFIIIISTNNIIELLFIQITLFIVFISLVQIIISRNQYSLPTLNKVFFFNSFTERYIGLNLSSILMLILFLLIYDKNIPRINLLASYLFIFINILLALYYLYWILNNLTTINIFRILCKQINSDELKKHINKIKKNQNKLDKEIHNNNSSKANIKIDDISNPICHLPEIYEIKLNKKGYLEDIDANLIILLNKINKNNNNKIDTVFIPYEIDKNYDYYSIKILFKRKNKKNDIDEDIKVNRGRWFQNDLTRHYKGDRFIVCQENQDLMHPVHYIM